MVDFAIHLTAVPGAEDEIAAALLANARASRMEPGAIRFDVLRSTTDPAVFLVIESYASDAALEAHRQTPHYAAWKAASEGRLAATERFAPEGPDGTGA
jgi:autoinducer 2-degrading protein